jgi:hypothetical protein
MRLQLSPLLAFAFLAPRAVAEPAPPAATATVRVYADDDRVTVWSPATRVAATAGPVDLALDLTIDAISAASVDVVTSASPAPVSEQRLEAGGALGVALPHRLHVSAGGAVSHEHDYDALSAAITTTAELADRNSTVELRLRTGDDRASDVTDPMFHGVRRTFGAALVLTQILDRRTITDATFDVSRADGWHGSPYRRVEVASMTGPFPTLVREATPDRRDAVAVALRIRRAFGERWFTSAIARGYRDDWHVASATLSLDLVTERADGSLAGITARAYAQRAADFWARRYDDAPPPPLRTADRSLGPMSTASVEAIFDRPVGARGLRLVAALGGTALFFDAPSQHRRLALTSTISVTWPLTKP